jgi:transcription antitermination factor NusG
MTELPWFALRVRSRCEKLAAKQLGERGFEVCAACAPQHRVWADRLRTVEMPMFAGYIFARFDKERAQEVLRVPGIISIVGFGTSYAPVDGKEMEAIQIVLAAGVAVFGNPQLVPGTRIRVLHGSLKGLEGTLMEIKNDLHLVLSVSLLRRLVSVEIRDMLVEPVANATAA